MPRECADCRLIASLPERESDTTFWQRERADRLVEALQAEHPHAAQAPTGTYAERLELLRGYAGAHCSGDGTERGPRAGSDHPESLT